MPNSNKKNPVRPVTASAAQAVGRITRALAPDVLTKPCAAATKHFNTNKLPQSSRAHAKRRKHPSKRKQHPGNVCWPFFALLLVPFPCLPSGLGRKEPGATGYCTVLCSPGTIRRHVNWGIIPLMAAFHSPRSLRDTMVKKKKKNAGEPASKMGCSPSFLFHVTVGP
jgi:hypothetical protein